MDKEFFQRSLPPSGDGLHARRITGRVYRISGLRIKRKGAIVIVAPAGYNNSMSHVIHFEDDIFIADGLVRVISDAAKLEPDADVIGDTVLSAIRLADATLRKIKNLVIQNEHLVDRVEYVRLLARTSSALSEAVTGIIRPEKLLAKTVTPSFDELERIASAQKALSTELYDVLREATVQNASHEDLVSGDELSELLRS